MKKFIKKIELKPLLISIGLVIFQSAFFFLSKLLQSNPHLIGNSIDDRIPFCNWFIIPYFLWYFMLFIVPYYYYKKDKDMLYKYILSYCICAVIAAVIFTIYPTTVARPTLSNNNILNFITNTIYFFDTPAINCLPSLHCAVSMLFILTAFTSKKVTNTFRIPVAIMSILVMIATLFVKQHVLIDVITGDILMAIIYLFVTCNKKNVNKAKKLLNL